MRHRGAHVGNFFLGDKEGGQEFTSADEEVLVLFAAQAATTIANARTHQDERRARADLDAPVSFNREARRIVEGLHTPGRPLEELLSVATCHRADGREISLAELPLVEQFNDSSRDGTRRGDGALGTGRPEREDAGQRHAAPFGGRCGRVGDRHPAGPGAAGGAGADADRVPGHGEPRAAGPADLHQGLASSPLHPAEMRQFFRIVDEQADLMRGLISDLLDAGRIETGTLSVTPEPVAVAGLVDRAARNTFLSGGGRHAVRIDLPRVLADRQRIVQVLNNLPVRRHRWGRWRSTSGAATSGVGRWTTKRRTRRRRSGAAGRMRPIRTWTAPPWAGRSRTTRRRAPSRRRCRNVVLAAGRGASRGSGFQHLPAPLRLRDVPAYVRSLGISSTLISELLPTKTLQGTPMRHRGAHVGNFFLGDKEGGQEFTSEDEEVLVLFAAQAATAIANARTHQDERRARADLEALIETSPVGVAVFDARTGAPVSFNREARRIVEGLLTPGRPPEELLSVATCHRADGRDISLAELSLVQQFNDSPETVRAEEIVLSVPDGRNVRMLVNATPLRSAAGEVESVIVTLQDLAPLEELERMRAEFLAMVSHELRAPLTSIKGSTATVLGASPRPRFRGGRPTAPSTSRSTLGRKPPDVAAVRS